MPALSTRGGAWSRIPRYPERLSGSNVTGVCYFNHGATSTAYRTKTREKFIFATASVSYSSSMDLVNVCANQSATSNGSTGIVATGFNGQNTPAKEKFIFSSETSVSTRSFSNYNTYSASIGNKDVAVTHLGWTTTYSLIRNLHAYSDDSNKVTTSASDFSYAGCGFGISAYGLFSIGGTSAGASIRIDKFTYATEALNVFTALGTANSGGCAGGNQTQALLAIGNQKITQLITYATSTIIASTLIPVKTIYGAAGSNDTNIVFCLGGTDTTNASNKKYNFTHSTKIFALTTNSYVSMWGGSAMSTSITGVNV